MISAWRIVKRRCADHAFDGDGARLYGGRWNSPGHPVVYVSESRALATLEVLAGLRQPGVMPAYVLIRVDVPEAIVSDLDVELPSDWKAAPPTHSTQRLGDVWLGTQRSATLRVPSVVVPDEFNYLLNPVHRDFKSIRIGVPEVLHFDPRLLPH